MAAEAVTGTSEVPQAPELSAVDYFKERRQDVIDARAKVVQAKQELETAEHTFERELRETYQGKWVRITGPLDYEPVWDNGDFSMERSYQRVSDYEGYVIGAWAKKDDKNEEVNPILFITKQPPSVVKQGEVRVSLFRLDSIEVIAKPGGKVVSTTKLGKVATEPLVPLPEGFNPHEFVM